MQLKRKQIVGLCLVLMLFVAGYIQYSYKNSSSLATGDERSEESGDSVYVGNDIPFDEEESASGTLDDENTAPIDDYFAQARLDKQVSLSRDSDSLQQITEDVNADKETKEKAYAQLMKMTENSKKEANIETLIKEKGFEDVLVLFGDDESLDILVKAPSLTSAEVAQISDIVSRQANIDLSKVYVRPVY